VAPAAPGGWSGRLRIVGVAGARAGGTAAGRGPHPASWPPRAAGRAPGEPRAFDRMSDGLEAAIRGLALAQMLAAVAVLALVMTRGAPVAAPLGLLLLDLGEHCLRAEPGHVATPLAVARLLEGVRDGRGGQSGTRATLHRRAPSQPGWRWAPRRRGLRLHGR
jgi:hypothetical protein